MDLALSIDERFWRGSPVLWGIRRDSRSVRSATAALVSTLLWFPSVSCLSSDQRVGRRMFVDSLCGVCILVFCVSALP